MKFPARLTEPILPQPLQNLSARLSRKSCPGVAEKELHSPLNRAPPAAVRCTPLQTPNVLFPRLGLPPHHDNSLFPSAASATSTPPNFVPLRLPRIQSLDLNSATWYQVYDIQNQKPRQAQLFSFPGKRGNQLTEIAENFTREMGEIWGKCRSSYWYPFYPKADSRIGTWAGSGQ